MKFLKNPKVLLSIIILISAVVRFQGISSNPPSLGWDEAALGYNAFSFGVDGRDEFGRFLPVDYIESFGDYKPPIYSYLDIIPVKLFGLNEFGVRFPSAFFGVLTVLLTYFLVKEVFFSISNKKRLEAIALSASLILALSPWHIMLSRGAYEANVSSFFIVLGILSFLIGINRKKRWLVTSAISFILALYTFNTARVFVPLLIIALGLGFRKKLFENRKHTIIAALIGLIVLLPLVPFLLSPQAKLRYQEVNIFSSSEIVEKSNQQIANDENALWSKIIHNRRVLFGQEFLKHYFDNFNPDFLFVKGDGNPRFSTQDVGQLLILDLPFLVIGLFVLFKKREGHFWIIPVWLLLGIIPAATARETPHALRIETVIPTFQIITAYGFVYFLDNFKKYKKLIASILFIILAFNFLYFYHGLHVHYSREYSSEWQYPYKELVSFTKDNEDNYDKVYVTTELGRPYIFFLVYNRISPQEFRDNSVIRREVFGFVHVDKFQNYIFRKELDSKNVVGKALFIDVPQFIPGEAKVLKEFRNLNGTVALIAYEIP